jgi:hypothetical protein
VKLWFCQWEEGGGGVWREVSRVCFPGGRMGGGYYFFKEMTKTKNISFSLLSTKYKEIWQILIKVTKQNKKLICFYSVNASEQNTYQ